METTELIRPRRWTERGSLRSFRATLTLSFAPISGESCDVAIEMDLRARGAAAPLAAALRLLAPAAVRSDLKRAARLLGLTY